MATAGKLGQTRALGSGGLLVLWGPGSGADRNIRELRDGRPLWVHTSRVHVKEAMAGYSLVYNSLVPTEASMVWAG